MMTRPLGLMRQAPDRWSDPATWAEEILFVYSPDLGGYGPLHLTDHQRHALQNAAEVDSEGLFVHRSIVYSWPRREGKSLLAAILGAWRLALFEHQRVLVLANSERQAQSVCYDLLVALFQRSPALSVYLRDEDLRQKYFQVLELDNRVEVLPAAWRTLQGRRTDLLISDELHAADGDAIKAFEFASQQLETRNAQAVVSSQAGSPVDSNPVWRLWQQRAASHVYFDLLTEHRQPWAQKLADREKETLLPALWRYQHLNEWGSSGSALLSPDDVQAAAGSYLEPESRAAFDRWRVASGFGDWTCTLAAGLDRAGVSRHGDRSVVTVVARFSPRQSSDETDAEYRVLRCDVLPTGHEREVLESFHQAEVRFGRLNRIVLESYQSADLVNRLPGAILATPSHQRQQVLFDRLHRLVVERRLQFPAAAGIDPRTRRPGLLKQELLDFQHEVRGGTCRFGVQPGHDDTVYALAWALDGLAVPAKQLVSWATLQEQRRRHRWPSEARRHRHAVR